MCCENLNQFYIYLSTLADQPGFMRTAECGHDNDDMDRFISESCSFVLIFWLTDEATSYQATFDICVNVNKAVLPVLDFEERGRGDCVGEC